VPSWQLLYNIGLAERRLFRYNDAVRTFRRFLDEGGDKVQPDRRARVEKELQEISASVAEVTVQVAGAPAEIEVDGAAAGKTPMDGPLLLGPGRHAIEARREGQDPDRKEIDVVSGQRLTVALSPTVRPTTAKLTVSSQPPGAALSIDGHFAGREPWAGTLDPGGHEVRAELAGFEKARMEVVLTAGQERAVTVELSKVTPSTKWYKRWWVWTLVGGVVAAGAVAGGVGGYIATHPGPDLAVDFHAH
jgi:hypothetical protein